MATPQRPRKLRVVAGVAGEKDTHADFLDRAADFEEELLRDEAPGITSLATEEQRRREALLEAEAARKKRERQELEKLEKEQQHREKIAKTQQDWRSHTRQQEQRRLEEEMRAKEAKRRDEEWQAELLKMQRQRQQQDVEEAARQPRGPTARALEDRERLRRFEIDRNAFAEEERRRQEQLAAARKLREAKQQADREAELAAQAAAETLLPPSPNSDGVVTLPRSPSSASVGSADTEPVGDQQSDPGEISPTSDLEITQETRRAEPLLQGIVGEGLAQAVGTELEQQEVRAATLIQQLQEAEAQAENHRPASPALLGQLSPTSEVPDEAAALRPRPPGSFNLEAELKTLGDPKSWRDGKAIPNVANRIVTQVAARKTLTIQDVGAGMERAFKDAQEKAHRQAIFLLCDQLCRNLQDLQGFVDVVHRFLVSMTANLQDNAERIRYTELLRKPSKSRDTPSQICTFVEGDAEKPRWKAFLQTWTSCMKGNRVLTIRASQPQPQQLHPQAQPARLQPQPRLQMQTQHQELQQVSSQSQTPPQVQPKEEPAVPVRQSPQLRLPPQPQLQSQPQHPVFQQEHSQPQTPPELLPPQNCGLQQASSQPQTPPQLPHAKLQQLGTQPSQQPAQHPSQQAPQQPSHPSRQPQPQKPLQPKEEASSQPQTPPQLPHAKLQQLGTQPSQQPAQHPSQQAPQQPSHPSRQPQPQKPLQPKEEVPVRQSPRLQQQQAQTQAKKQLPRPPPQQLRHAKQEDIAPSPTSEPPPLDEESRRKLESGTQKLKEAEELEARGDKEKALSLYITGLQMQMEVIKRYSDHPALAKVKEKVDMYLERAEQLKRRPNTGGAGADRRSSQVPPREKRPLPRPRGTGAAAAPAASAPVRLNAAVEPPSKRLRNAPPRELQ
eukprot:TRINITY_DN3310_c0_g1_i1.p1 TRINITY_DN3310_c0_g1~~TRINITY_DN3310_c0_g1_i1.p1  ORF type:complete len:903 (-),score=265.50 TRINITY_DN3310_c0_g1_i1:75-2762(-)